MRNAFFLLIFFHGKELIWIICLILAEISWLGILARIKISNTSGDKDQEMCLELVFPFGCPRQLIAS